MKKNEEFSRKPAHFLKSACLALCLVSYGGSAIYAASTYAEQTTLTVRMNNRTVKDVFSYIEKNSEFIFVYHGSNINLNRKVNVDVDNQTVEAILKKMFEGTDIEYIINDRQIIVRKNETNKKQVAVVAPQQEKKITVTGNVKDATGEPLIGVNVLVKGTTIGGVTDVDGNYSLPEVSPNAVISISYIGYQTQDIPLNGKSTLNVTLSEDSETLDEVIVVGYGTQKKANLSGAVDAITSKALENRPITNVGQGLQGTIPNLNITVPSGSANEASKFNIRGKTSINDGDPLILVDNIPTTAGELSRLNTNDIESISVLKDAASAAIYGARAAFGVILVTTKAAKTDKIAIGVNAYYSTRKISRLPKHVTDPYLVMDVKNQAAWPLYNPLYTQEQMNEAKKYSENPSLNPVALNPTDPNKWAYYGHTDWMDEVYNSTAPSYTVNFNISQRGKKVGYYFSGEYFDQDGMYRYGNDLYKRYNMRGKVDYQITDWLNVSNNTSFTYRTYDEPSFGESGWSTKDFFHMVNRTNSLDVPKNPDGTWTSSGGALLGKLQDGGRKVNNSREFQTSFATTIDLMKDVWQLKADATFRRDSEITRKSFLPYTYKTGPERPLETSGITPSARNESAFYDYNVFNVYTDFHKTFNEKHYLQAMVGFNQEYRKTNSFWVSRDQLISSGYPTPELATGTVKTSETIKEWSVRGTFFRLNYIYDNRYIVEFNGRYDGTSKFPKNDRYGFFPSASAAWTVSEESFFSNVKETLNMTSFKLRGSYGSLGNQGVDEYTYLPSMSTYEIGSILDGSRPIGIYMPYIVSSNLTWEKVSTVNGGIDLSFFDNRLTANYDYYVRYTTGMLTKGKTLPNVVGIKEPKENAADMKTRGWELSVAWRDQFNLKDSPFNYGIRLVLADSRSFITKFDNYVSIRDANGKEIGKTSSLDDYYVGQEIGELWGLTTEGFFQSEEELKNHADQSKVGEDDQGYQFYVGDLKFKDLNGDGKIDKGDWTLANPGDYKKIGNKSNRLPFSIDLTADWKGFDVRAFFQGIAKKDWYADGGNHYFWGIYAQPWTNVQEQNLDHWTPENPNAYFPRIKAYIAESTGSELAAVQTKYLQNAAYMRMKNFTFGYTLPKSLTQKAGIERLRFYFSGENLFEFSGLKANLDPEALDDDGKVYPLQRSFSFGFNLNF